MAEKRIHKIKKQHSEQGCGAKTNNWDERNGGNYDSKNVETSQKALLIKTVMHDK